FNISSVERLRHFGLLRSIGLTPKQLKKILIGEALLLALIFVPIGVIVGGLGTKLILRIINNIIGMKSQGDLNLFNVIVPMIIGFISIIIASISPARISSKISPIESLNIEGNIIENSKGKSKKKNKNKVIQKMFGYTGKIAFTNLVRNKKRFYATVISISISIALFITANYLVKNLNPYYQVQKSIDSDYVLSLQISDEPIGYSEEVINEIKNIHGIKSIEKMKFYHSSLELKKSHLSEKGFEENKDDPTINKDVDEEWPYTVSSMFVGLSEEKLKESGIYEPMAEQGDKLPNLYIMQNLNYQDITNVVKNDKVQVKFSYKHFPNRIRMSKIFRVAKVLKKPPITFNARDGDSIIFMSTNDMEKYLGLKGYQKIDINVTEDGDIQSIEQKLNEIANNQKYGKLTIFRDQLAMYERFRLEIASILYILIGVIILVGLVNIVNIMTINVILRRREFGMLRALGMTNQQLRKVLTKEGLFYGLISSGIGSIVGIALICLVYYSARRGIDLELEFDYISIISACLITTILTVLSTLLPLRKAISLNVVESIRAID
ncbi:ABC transporter permease, partial [Sporosalibacterium faouarense]|uniref:ABC transporter permease n=1 Tax=Sporosalibacterium faouarense TaxID=516123 RepID=UPI00192BCAA2